MSKEELHNKLNAALANHQYPQVFDYCEVLQKQEGDSSYLKAVKGGAFIRQGCMVSVYAFIKAATTPDTLALSGLWRTPCFPINQFHTQ